MCIKEVSGTTISCVAVEIDSITGRFELGCAGLVFAVAGKLDFKID
jgi:hypothetical protein